MTQTTPSGKYHLGKKPAQLGAYIYHWSNFFKAKNLPKPTLVFGRTGFVPEDGWGMLANDKCGDCTIAGAAHETMLFASLAGKPIPAFSEATAISDYSDACGYVPGDATTDNGGYLVQVATYRLKTGVVDASGQRHKIDGFVSLPPGDTETLALATFTLGATGIGISLPDSAERQFDNREPWDVVHGAKVLGGHYVPCLHGDTKISLLDGNEVPIKELVGTDQWVYALNSKHNVTPALATNIRRTKKSAKLIRIHLDNAEYFDCTSDHLIMMRDGNYIAAQELTVGQSLMPLYRRTSETGLKGYEEILDPSNERWQFTHRRVGGVLQGLRPGMVVHHIDFNKRNNTPDNLRVMGWDEHTQLHMEHCDLLNDYAKSEQGRQRSRELMINNWNSKEFRTHHDSHLKTNPKLWRHRKSGFHNLERQQENGRKTGANNLKNARGKKSTEKRTAAWQKTFASNPSAVQMRARINGSKLARLTKEEVEFISTALKGAEKGTAAKLAAQFGVGRPKITLIKQGRYLSHLMNHRVTAIEQLSGAHEVYDMEVPRYHNFAISPGVFVHNCLGRNSRGNFIIITWGRAQAVTPAFLQRYNDESVAYLDFEQLRDSVSQRGYDAVGLQAAFGQFQ